MIPHGIQSYFSEIIRTEPWCWGTGLSLAVLLMLIIFFRIKGRIDGLYRSLNRLTVARYILAGTAAGMFVLWMLGLLYEVLDSNTYIDFASKVFSFMVFFLVCFLILISIFRWTMAFRDKSSRGRLFWAALGIWASGYVLYFIGFFSEGTRHSPAALILRPAMSAAELFISSRDLLEVAGSCKENPVYMGAYAIVSAAALLVSASFVISLTGIRIKEWVKIKTMKLENDESLYVFWGVNEASLLLAKSIQAKYGTGHQADIVFIDPREENEDEVDERLSLEHILNLFLLRRKSYRVIRDSGINASICVCETDMNAWRQILGQATGEKDAFGVLMRKVGLKDIARMMRDACRTNIFFLSESEEDNIERTIIMCDIIRDSENSQSGKIKNPTIYCSACTERVNGTEMFSFEDYPSVRIVDTSALSVNQLAADTELLPVKCVRPDTSKGIATKPFTALIVGFGKTGHEVLKYLYETGVFADADGHRNPFKCYITDPKADALKEHFFMCSPALRESDEIIFINGTEDTPGYWKKLRSVINELDYVVVSVGNDNKGLSLGSDIFDLALKYRSSENRFNVLVRTYAARYYHRAKRVMNYYSHLGSGHAQWRFSVFGRSEDIITYDNILEDRTLENAKQFYHCCLKHQGKDTSSYSWEIRRKEYSGRGMENYSRIMQLERQNISCSRHIGTKMILAGIHNANDPGLGLLLKAIGGRDTVSAEYPKATSEQKELLKNLALCEHFRRCTTDMLLGYPENWNTSIDPCDCTAVDASFRMFEKMKSLPDSYTK